MCCLFVVVNVKPVSEKVIALTSHPQDSCRCRTKPRCRCALLGRVVAPTPRDSTQRFGQQHSGGLHVAAISTETQRRSHGRSSGRGSYETRNTGTVRPATLEQRDGGAFNNVEGADAALNLCGRCNDYFCHRKHRLRCAAQCD